MGSEMGMYEYGLRLFRSAKDVKERELGLSWLWRSARSDCGEAQAALGFLFGKDSSVQDFNQSLYWLGRAVNNEVAGAAATYASIWYEENGGLFIDEEEHGKIVQMLKGALDRGETSAAGVLGDLLGSLRTSTRHSSITGEDRGMTSTVSLELLTATCMALAWKRIPVWLISFSLISLNLVKITAIHRFRRSLSSTWEICTGMGMG